MGNSSAKEARPGSSRSHSRPDNVRDAGSPTTTGPSGSSSHLAGDRLATYTSRGGRGSRPDLSFLGIGGSSDQPPAEARRETKAEREARKLEEERAAREKERERSIREEGVDGGYLVTLGTYTGPEDFNKDVVRQLMIERRLAPFWKGLNDHSDMWTEHQLVAVVNGLPIPPADEIPPEEPPRSTNLSVDWNPRSSNSNINHLTVPITSRSQSSNSDRSMNLSPSHPAFSLPSPTSPISASPSSSSPFFRGRAKTLAALTTSSKNNSQTEMTPQEVQLPKDPYVNGQRLEAFLYKNATECPICFLYYPPYLNKTRCCDQPICSECFVQIKRPDPHIPEHHDPTDPNASKEPQEDGMLVSEPASCPFCVQPEFGVTYEPPPFRRGLSYAGQAGQAGQAGHPLASTMSAMSSSSSLASQGLGSPTGNRRRTTSLSANNASVITTDRVRPDWAKKLSDARAHALRRAAAATALHNAAYVMGNIQAADGRGFVLGRRRRTMFGGDSGGSSGNHTPRHGDGGSVGSVGALLAAAERSGGSGPRGQDDLFPGRHSSRRNRIEDLEDLMMMEAIRLSIAAEEERKKKEEKESAKESRKEEKRKAKETKKAEKAARKTGFFPSTSFDRDTDTTNAGLSTIAGKGKGVDRSGAYTGFNPLSEPTSTINASGSKEDPQRHLEHSRAQIQSHSSTAGQPAEPPTHRQILRNLSNASSSASSFSESLQGSLQQVGGFGASGSSFEPSPTASGVSLNRDETSPGGTTGGLEPMFNFTSLAEVIGVEDDKHDQAHGSSHIENLANHNSSPNHGQGREGSAGGESSSSSAAPPVSQPHDGAFGNMDESTATITGKSMEDLALVATHESNQYDAKHFGDVSLLETFGQGARSAH
ncbi:uncharacterized protein BDZ99DRAFT_230334 [Mytilinidion resinicola]|uniref:Protein SIP5 n=1 Tax=Mytilinidion resinicola TaxID=574789 RepID=A0A6A6Z1B8_9PEZI|nr:uncharacterized protein BDZ99DRAFT_230334 [Mytilinidion resinicola]KAF2814027.1 hypothetical protein BDZ99DRAFT_230334 [Mytilinidion resinicola]